MNFYFPNYELICYIVADLGQEKFLRVGHFAHQSLRSVFVPLDMNQIPFDVDDFCKPERRYEMSIAIAHTNINSPEIIRYFGIAWNGSSIGSKYRCPPSVKFSLGREDAVAGLTLV